MSKQAIPSGMTEKEYYETMADESAIFGMVQDSGFAKI